MGATTMTDASNEPSTTSDEEYFPEFHTVRRGYDPDEVEQVLDEVYASLNDAVREAQSQTARREAAERAEAELTRALTEARGRIAELEKHPAAGGQAFEHLGSRIDGMLEAAATEATAIVSRAHEEAQVVHDEAEATAVTTRAETDHYVADVRGRAEKEAKGIKARARSEADRILAEARALRETQQRADVEAHERLAAELAERQAQAEAQFQLTLATHQQRLASLTAEIDSRTEQLAGVDEVAAARAEEIVAQARSEAAAITDEARRLRDEALEHRARVRAQLADLRGRLALVLPRTEPAEDSDSSDAEAERFEPDDSATTGQADVPPSGSPGAPAPPPESRRKPRRDTDQDRFGPPGDWSPAEAMADLRGTGARR